MADYVYICYDAQEKIKAHDIRKKLEQSGISCQIMPMSIPEGFDYRAESLKAIKNCRIFLVLLSKCAMESQFVQNELQLAVLERKIIMPVLIENIPLSEELRFYLSDACCYSMYENEEAAFQNITEAVKQILFPPVQFSACPLPPPYTASANPCKSSAGIGRSPRMKGSSKTGMKPWFSRIFHKKEKPSTKMDHIPVPPILSNVSDGELFSVGSSKEKQNMLEIGSLAVSEVQFSAVVAKKAETESYIPVDIVMFEDEFRSIVAEKLDENNQEVRGGYHQVASQSKIRVVLTAKGAEIEDNEEERIGQGKYLDFQFLAYVPEDYRGKQIPFCATVYVNDVIATRLRFVVNVSCPQTITPEREDITSAFVSYSSDDRVRVTSIVQGMKKARPDLDLFMDVESLRSGEDWEKELKRAISERSVFYLCWSQAAKASKWVEFEWRYALEQKGEECIEPIPIDPPEELSKKHFNDKMVYMVKALEYMSRKTPYITVTKEGLSEKICIRKERFLLGRDSNRVDCSVMNRQVSSVHAEIIKENGEYFIVDLGSTNHTYVDGSLCERGKKMPVGHGSVILLANESILFELL